MKNKYLSRLPGFYRYSIKNRKKILEDNFNISKIQTQKYYPQNGLNLYVADKMVENCIGIFGLPLGVALNFLVDNESVIIPMVIEEPSVIAACSRTAALVGTAGGFKTNVDNANMIGQIQLDCIGNIENTILQIKKNYLKLINFANNFCIDMVKRGGGVRELSVKKLYPVLGEFSKFDNEDPMLIVEFVIDCCESMGANIVNKVAEGLGKEIAKLTSCQLGLQILSNLSDKRLARASCSIPVKLLSSNKFLNNGYEIAKKIINAFRFSLRDPYRAATHNKGILNSIDSVAIATGNDWRAIEAGAHAFASRTGAYTSLTKYKLNELSRELECTIILPLAVGIIGGSINAHPVVQSNLSLLGSFGKSAKKLAGLMAAAGLSQNLGALISMCSEGIQKGHMKLHARKNVNKNSSFLEMIKFKNLMLMSINCKIAMNFE